MLRKLGNFGIRRLIYRWMPPLVPPSSNDLSTKIRA